MLVGGVVDPDLSGVMKGGRYVDLQMAVKVDDADGTVGSDYAAKKRKGDGVVAAEGDDSRQGFAGF